MGIGWPPLHHFIKLNKTVETPIWQNNYNKGRPSAASFCAGFRRATNQLHSFNFKAFRDASLMRTLSPKVNISLSTLPPGSSHYGAGGEPAQALLQLGGQPEDLSSRVFALILPRPWHKCASTVSRGDGGARSRASVHILQIKTG